jgi:hypothetical protein
VSDWREMVSDEAMPGAFQQSAELPWVAAVNPTKGTTMAGDELRQPDLERAEMERDHPAWEFGYTINNRPRARRPNASPPVWLWGEDWTDLRDQVRAAIADRPSLGTL